MSITIGYEEVDFSRHVFQLFYYKDCGNSVSSSVIFKSNKMAVENSFLLRRSESNSLLLIFIVTNSRNCRKNFNTSIFFYFSAEVMYSVSTCTFLNELSNSFPRNFLFFFFFLIITHMFIIIRLIKYKIHREQLNLQIYVNPKKSLHFLFIKFHSFLQPQVFCGLTPAVSYIQRRA